MLEAQGHSEGQSDFQLCGSFVKDGVMHVIQRHGDYRGEDGAFVDSKNGPLILAEREGEKGFIVLNVRGLVRRIARV